MKEFPGNWLICVPDLNRPNPVDQFFAQLLHDDPSAFCEFEGYVAPIVEAYGPDARDPLIELAPTADRGWIRWFGDAHVYRIEFLIDEEKHHIVLLDADSSPYEGTKGT